MGAEVKKDRTKLHISTARLAALSLAFYAAGMTGPMKAQAGFDWTPPAAGEKQISGPPVDAVPVTPVEIINFHSAPVTEGAAPAINERPVEDGAMNDLTPPPPAMEITTEATMESPAGALSAPEEGYTEAVGFGKDIPLAMVLQQIVPPGFAYAFASGVDAGQRLSWNGGRPWNSVLQDALAPAGLEAVIVDKMVKIQPVSAGAAMPVSEPEVNPFAENAPAPKTAFAPEAVPLMPLPDVTNAETVDAEVPYPSMGHESAMSDVPVIKAPSSSLSMPPIPLRAVPKDTKAVEYVPSYPRREKPKSFIKSLLGDDSPPQAVAQTGAMEMTMQPATPTGSPFELSNWHADAGADLQTVLAAWSTQANVYLMWQSDRPYKLPREIMMDGTYADAVNEILGMYKEGGQMPVGKLHQNLPDGPPVLIVESISARNASN